MTEFSDMLYHLGGVPASLGVPFSKNSNYYFVDPANGSSSGSGSMEDPCDKVSTAYDLCVANQHDTVIYIAGSSGCTETSTITWSKDYTHLIGIAAPTMMAQRARIFAGVNGSPFFTISASGCIFKNLYIFQGRDDASSLINVKVTGGRNYFENVHFAGGGHATQAVDGGASLLLDGSSAEENTFRDCTFGVDTIAAASGMMAMRLDGATHRHVFRNCHLSMYAGDTAAGFVEVVDATGFDRYIIFDDCLFTNTNKANYEMASGFVIPAIAANRPSRIFMKRCIGYGLAKWDANDRGVLMGDMNDVTGADTSGVAVEMVT